MRVQSFGSADVFQILVISPNQKRFFGPLEPMTPFLQGQPELEGQKVQRKGTLEEVRAVRGAVMKL